MGALGFPCFGQAHGGVGVGHAKAVAVMDRQSSAVPIEGAVGLPSTGRIDRVVGRIGEDLLDVPVSKVRVGLEHECRDPGHRRCRERGAADVRIIAGGIPGVAQGVRREDTDAGRRRQHGGAGGAEIGQGTGGIHGARGYRELRRLIAVIVGVLSHVAGIPGREGDDRTQAVSSVGGGVFNGGALRGEGRGVEIVVEKAAITPAVIGHVHRGDVLHLGYFLAEASVPAVAHSEHGNIGVGSHTDGARAVHCRGDNAGGGGPVSIVGGGGK